MKLIGPWMSGYARRVGITMKLLGIPFEHLNWGGPSWRESIQRYSPMIKVPALVLDDGEVIVDSSAIVDYLYELAGPEKALLPTAGPDRRLALYHSAIALEIYGKQVDIYREMHQHGATMSRRLEYYTQQAMAGFRAIEDKAEGQWLQGDVISHADIMAVVSYQSLVENPLFLELNGDNFPHLAKVVHNAMTLPAFYQTLS